jgi:glycosyltransferase involved in cell wall biosynthesis
MRRYKGIDVFLRAFAALSEEQRQNATVLIVGQSWGDLAEQYDALIDELGLHEHVVKRYAYVPMQDVKYYFEACDVVALPYRHFAAQSAVGSLVLAFGKPLLVTRVGGLPTLVQREEALCEPGDVTSLRDGIARLLDDPKLRQQLAAGSRDIAAERCSRGFAARTIGVYQTVTGEDFLAAQEPG